VGGSWQPLPDETPEVSTFPISPITVEALKKRGITHFTKIQVRPCARVATTRARARAPTPERALTPRGFSACLALIAQTGAFGPIMEGRDILARSRTGTGKTLAFALPIVESIGKSMEGRPKAHQPLCIVLVPTRELAKQVASEFELISGAHRLNVCAVYGGAPMGPQIRELRSGCHVVVGTPGRVLDHVNQGTLDLSSIRHAVLDEVRARPRRARRRHRANASPSTLRLCATSDLARAQSHPTATGRASRSRAPSAAPSSVPPARHPARAQADEMLDMGFADDVASILNGAPPAGSRQMLLFSATTPPFIQALVRQHMRDELQLDAVGANDGPKTSTTVQHYAVLAPERNEHRPAVLRDVLTVHGRGAKRVIVFTETKRDCDELVTGRQLGTLSAAALHGDVQQQQRETTMKNFREGKFTVLVATDVAARGIDVSGVDLVISYHVPMSTESYVHRSGRTGRAGASGKSLILYNEGRFGQLARMERECQFKFHRVGPPAPEAVIAAAAVNLPSLIQSVDKEVLPLFAATARKIMAEASDDATLESK
jgi:superfamily II DNA/RNA helicase